MDQNEDKEIDPQTLCPYRGNVSNSESQLPNLISYESPPQMPVYDMNRYGAMEELDFEDEKVECNSSAFIGTSQPCNDEKICPKELKEVLRNADELQETTCILTENKNLETTPESLGVGCNDRNSVEIEEGEATDDDINVDMEDGEIKGKSKTPKQVCRFYQRGMCLWGNECNYLHLTDKGLYKMFDSPSITKLIYRPAGFVNKCNFFYPVPQEPPNRLEGIWDQALIEAKERIRQSKRKREECFEENLYMTVEDDRLVDKWEYSHDRNVLPAPISQRQINDFSYRNYYVRHPKPNNMKKESRLVRKTYGSKSNKWRDPWRRSKTPPHHKRSNSKPLSDGTKSRGNSQSSWTSRSCQSPSPKHAKVQSHSKHSRSHPYKAFRIRSPSTSPSHTSSSRSHSESTSRSGSSSLQFKSKQGCSHTKKRKVSSHSPVYRKNRVSLTKEGTVLPYKRQSRLMLHSTKIFQQQKTNDHECRSGSPKNSHSHSSKSRLPRHSSKVRPAVRDQKYSKVTHTYKSRLPCGISKIKPTSPEVSLSKVTRAHSSRSRSLSNTSSASSAQSELSDADSSDRSSSDMSISPVSYSSVNRKSKFSNKELQLESHMRDSEDSKHPRDNLNSLRTVVAPVRPYDSTTNQKKFAGRSGVPVTLETAAQRKAAKRASALEMELMKYGGGFRSIMKCPQIASKKPHPSKKVFKQSNFKNSKCEKGPVPHKNRVGVEGTLSKRDQLIKQLKAVEEAIANRKKFYVAQGSVQKS